MASQIFSTKSPDQLLNESENPERQMKRTLSAFDLTALGIGAIIGAGIFSLVGTAFAGETFSSKIKTPLMNLIIAAVTGIGRATRKTGCRSGSCDFINTGYGCLRLCSFLLCRACFDDSWVGKAD